MPRDNHYAAEAHSRDIPICPKCGNVAGEAVTQYGIRNQCDPCGLWSWDRYPLVDGETHHARKVAHAAFDHLWRGEGMKRGDAYKLLAAELGLDRRDCHIKLMDKETAARVPAAVERIRKGRRDVD